MLEVLTNLPGVSEGLGVSLVIDSGASDLFLHIHYLAQCMLRRQKVLLISSHLNEGFFRTICGRLPVRWDSSLITFRTICDYLPEELSAPLDDVPNKIVADARDVHTVLFDDFSSLERCRLDVVAARLLLKRLESTVAEGGLVLATFTQETHLFKLVEKMADFAFRVSLIGHGFASDVTGQLNVRVQATSLEATETQLLYLTTERGAKCFYPGSVPLASFS